MLVNKEVPVKLINRLKPGPDMQYFSYILCVWTKSGRPPPPPPPVMIMNDLNIPFVMCILMYSPCYHPAAEYLVPCMVGMHFYHW